MSYLAATDNTDALTRELPTGDVDAAEMWRRPSVRLSLAFLALTGLGLVMSASTAGQSDFIVLVLKRLALTGAGVAVFVFASRTPYQFWRRHHLPALALAAAGLGAVLIPGVGVQINGARRWIATGLGIGFQPSEFAKIALCIWVAAYCERNLPRMRNVVAGFMAPLVVIGAVASLIVIEPDLGTAVLTAAVSVSLLFVFGTRISLMALAGAAILPMAVKLVTEVPWRMQRVMTFLDPWVDPKGSGYQLIQSQIAIGSGGLFGVGLGMGRQKTGFLPGAENDFVFSVVAEELGFVGCCVVILLFLFVIVEGMRVAFRSRDPFAFGLALGLTMLIGLQAAVHVAVVTGSIPTKGLSLPFISAGGSSLLASMLAAGIIVNIARTEELPDRYELRGWREDMPGYERLARRAAGGPARLCGRMLHRISGR